MTGSIAIEQRVDSCIKQNTSYSNDAMINIMENVKKAVGKCTNFHHLTFWVSNAKQYSTYFCVCFGFEPFAYSGLETGDRVYATHVVKQNDIILAFVSPLNASEKSVNQHIIKHGDGVSDISFIVDDLETLIDHCKSRGGEVLKDIWTEKDDEGEVKMAIIKAFGDTTHTLIERKNYKGEFLPGFKKPLHKVIKSIFFQQS